MVFLLIGCKNPKFNSSIADFIYYIRTDYIIFFLTFISPMLKYDYIKKQGGILVLLKFSKEEYN